MSALQAAGEDQVFFCRQGCRIPRRSQSSLRMEDHKPGKGVRGRTGASSAGSQKHHEELNLKEKGRESLVLLSRISHWEKAWIAVKPHDLELPSQ